MNIIDRFTVHNKLLFFIGALIFMSASLYSNAKSDNSTLITILMFLGAIIMCLGFRKPTEKDKI
jgi:hypothetical protein